MNWGAGIRLRLHKFSKCSVTKSVCTNLRSQKFTKQNRRVITYQNTEFCIKKYRMLLNLTFKKLFGLFLFKALMQLCCPASLPCLGKSRPKSVCELVDRRLLVATTIGISKFRLKTIRPFFLSNYEYGSICQQR